jgi:hypothetical protein
VNRGSQRLKWIGTTEKELKNVTKLAHACSRSGFTDWIAVVSPEAWVL